MLDYDAIDDWAPALSKALEAVLPVSLPEEVVAAGPEFIEDARDLVFDLGGRDAIIDRAIAWIRSETIVAYHGSRLTLTEVARVQGVGLLPLVAEARRERLVRALSRHPEWETVRHRLDAEIAAYGPGETLGRRESQVHLTLSKAGLTEGFSHYLLGGSEFDQRVAHALLGRAGEDMLKTDADAVVIHVAVPGPKAIEAAHPHFTVDDVRRTGDVPNIVNQFLCAWAFRFIKPHFQARTLKTDCGLVFRCPVPADWITRVEPWAPKIKHSVKGT